MNMKIVGEGKSAAERHVEAAGEEPPRPELQDSSILLQLGWDGALPPLRTVTKPLHSEKRPRG